MKTNLPVKKLIIGTVWLAVFIFATTLTTGLLRRELDNIQRLCFNAGVGSLLVILIAIVNIILFLCFEQKLTERFKSNVFVFLGWSYFLTLIVFPGVLMLLFNHAGRLLIYPLIVYLLIISILVNTLVLFMLGSIILQDTRQKLDRENARLKAANVEAVNQLLRQQIQPHFLFNALNILKSLYRINPEAGERYLIRLSDFLRASVSNYNEKVSSLADEVKLCRDYLEMQKIRFGKALHYTIELQEELLIAKFVPSFSIQPLLENALKHNELTEQSPLFIQIKEENNCIVVVNNLQPKESSESSIGSGLTNLAERYRLLANYDIEIQQTGTEFSVSIQILDNEYNNH